MRDVKKIEIIFENCEYIEFTPKDFGIFLLDDITTSISRIACNSISELKHAKTVALEIFDTKLNSTYNPFGIESESKTIKSRFALCDDITSIEITFADDSKQEYYVEWGNDEYTNEHQKTELGENGNLYIVIGKDKNISDYFDNDAMNDKEMAKSHKELISLWGESYEQSIWT